VERFDEILGMGHPAEDIAACVEDTGNVVDRAVGIAFDRRGSPFVDVAERDPIVRLEPVERSRVSAVVTVAMSDWAGDDLAFEVLAGEQRRRRLNPKMDLAADKAEAGIPHQDSREEACLAKDLEAVADAQHCDAALRLLGDGPHDRGASGDRTRPQIIAVGKSAGENDEVDRRQGCIGVPDGKGFAAGDPLERDEHIVVAV
jgi:hypothetical protein